RLVAALASAAREADDAPEGYWAAFDARVAARVAGAAPSAVGTPNAVGPTNATHLPRRLLLLAAAIGIAAIGVMAWHARQPGIDGAEEEPAASGPAEVLATMRPDEVDAALATLGADGLATFSADALA